MRITQATIGYTEARSANFQKAESSIQITVELAEGETLRDAINKYRPKMVEDVRDLVIDRIVEMANEAKQGGWTAR